MVDDQVLADTYRLDMFKVSADDPFELTTEHYSPLYIDARRWTADPEVRDRFGEAMRETVAAAGIDYDTIDAVVGGATAGIIPGYELAERLGAPYGYVRKEAKGHGKRSAVEGVDVAGKNVLLVEDLTTTGSSLTTFIDNVAADGGTVTDCLVFYDREQGAVERVEETGAEMHGVVDLSELLTYGREHDYLTDAELATVEAYLDDPEAWSEQYQQ